MNRRTCLIMGLTLVVAFVTLGCASLGLRFSGVQGSGKIAEEIIDVRGVTRVELSTVGTLYVNFGDREELRIEAEDNLIPLFETDMRHGTLEIRARPGASFNSTRPIRFHLTIKELERIALSSSGDAEVPDFEAGDFSALLSSSGDLRMGNLTANSVELHLSSSGDLSMGNLQAEMVELLLSSSGDLSIDSLRAESLTATLSSAGNVTIAGGRVERQELRLSSSGDYEAPDLESAEAEARLSSSGNATIRVSERLDATITSSGDLRYIGSPRVNVRGDGPGGLRQIRP